MRRPGFISLAAGLLSTAFILSSTVAPVAADITTIHKPGYCAFRGQCGRKSFFGSQLPCPDNGRAEEPDDTVRQQLVSICGAEWSDGDVCCTKEQLSDLKSNLDRAGAIISSCPACKANFVNLFCQFTCSPDQSTFINVTAIEKTMSKKDAIAELDYHVSEEYASGFYDSCKDVKFGATNGNAMDFIGGGAKNYTEFLAFLGKKQALGSPFQMNFPRDVSKPLKELSPEPKRCDGDDPSYRCSCVDCPSTCPPLPSLDHEKACNVGKLPCMSFAVIIIYAGLLFLLISGFVAKEAWKHARSRRSERMQLFQQPGDDDDDGSIHPQAWDHNAKEYSLNTVLDDFFSKIGKACARYPALTIGTSLLVVGVMSLGWLNFQIETDPVRLWVSPTSEAAAEKAFFDENFGPFYRAQQAFLVNDTKADGVSPVLSYETLGWWFDVENRIRRLKSLDGTVLDEVCYKPTGEGCVIQSVTSYFGNNFYSVKPDNWKTTLRSCADMPIQSSCLPDFGQPIKKEMILGGVPGNDVADAKALISTWVLTNYADESSEEIKKAMGWERSLKNLMLTIKEEAKDRGLRLSFSTEISLEQELNKSTNTDANIIIISYIAMFIYASIALGGTGFLARNMVNDPKWIFVDSKFTLGVAGIVIVLLSVSASVGIFSAMGIKVTLIIAEVIPFLVLAIGVDNIFLIVHEFEKVNHSYGSEEPVENRVSRALGRMGPSILLSAVTETIAFSLGAAVGMPAVRNFAIYAAGAVAINAVLQVTLFVAVLALNQKRAEDSRVDCFPCVKVRAYGSWDGSQNDSCGLVLGGYGGVAEDGIVDAFVKNIYAPFLLRRKVRFGVILFFLGLLTAGLALIPKVQLGLDQRIALPSDSYLIDYFNDLDNYFGVGAPVYFVTKEFNATAKEEQKALCGRFTTCDTYSLASILEQERKRPEVSYIAEATASWVDDFFLWLNPANEQCCRVNKRTGELCDPDSPARQCKVCFADRDPAWNITLSGMPQGKEFLDYLKIWLQAPTGEECAIAGKAAYSHAIVPDYKRNTINATHFRTSHTPLRSQDDFIKAYASARRIAKEISKNTGAPVFPYSKFYIFFDQYANIKKLTVTLLLSALATIFVVTSVFLGSVRVAGVVTVTVAMVIVDIIGSMALFGVSLNAVSLVNLVIAVGISVEFCSHLARAFQFPGKEALLADSDSPNLSRVHSSIRFQSTHASPANSSSLARAYSALANVGGSVFTGITLTKFLGVSVLAFTRSKIFEIYYFRMWVSLVVLGALHALVWLPVALSFVGGQGWSWEDDGGVEDDLRIRTRLDINETGSDDDSDDEDRQVTLPREDSRGRTRGRK
ncbi:multidrug efflux transporter AcrB transmembrane domain-containing protein [Ascobolus immersus RN42]|uniref:Multidrug efflux transporter AcrB transmembrane domain-containing protein n=1 Tax=Ascobolus immersus RN42 TaxID=1160509 RepID=A0A3N4I610_ASCIM|nr:multidrug efflux transporter AcrB transmembrane domain-containing protein [Ascobolus immersus RN42]